MEEWKDVIGYEGFYQVSNTGKVKSLIKNRILNERKQDNGYVSVMLYKDRCAKFHSIHRIVAEAFLENKDNKPFVNHKDENKRNNHVENLEWCTRKHNMNCGTINKRLSEKRGHDARRKRKVCQKNMSDNIVACWESIADAARETHTARTSIYQCCRGIHHSANGYKWSYLEV